MVAVAFGTVQSSAADRRFRVSSSGFSGSDVHDICAIRGYPHPAPDAGGCARLRTLQVANIALRCFRPLVRGRNCFRNPTRQFILTLAALVRVAGRRSAPSLPLKNILDLFLFFTWQPAQASDTFSAVKVAPRIATGKRK